MAGHPEGYSQVATWPVDDGRTIDCPARGADLWCTTEGGIGRALVPQSGRALLVATAGDAPGQADIEVAVGDLAFAFDLAVVGVGLALTLLTDGAQVTAPAGMVSDLALRLIPEAIAAKDAAVHGDTGAFAGALAALGGRGADVILDHLGDWEVAIGISLASNLLPHVATVRLMLAAARAVPPLLALAHALADSERTTVRVPGRWWPADPSGQVHL